MNALLWIFQFAFGCRTFTHPVRSSVPDIPGELRTVTGVKTTHGRTPAPTPVSFMHVVEK